MSWFISIILLSFAVILLIFGALVMFVAIQGAPFVPTSKKRTAIIKSFACSYSSAKVADLGSGDGRLMVAIAKSGIIVHGYEINPGLIFISRLWIRLLGLQKKALVYNKIFWYFDLSSFYVVVVYCIDHIMERLEKKLLKELKPGARVISNNFKFPNWEYREEKDRVFLYLK